MILYNEKHNIRSDTVVPHIPPRTTTDMMTCAVMNDNDNNNNNNNNNSSNSRTQSGAPLLEFSVTNRRFAGSSITVVSDWDLNPDIKNLTEEQNRKLSFSKCPRSVPVVYP